MPDICSSVKHDENAYRVCNHLVDNYGLTVEDFDTPIPYVVWRKGEELRLEYVSPNKKVDSFEVYSKAVELVEGEEEENRGRLLACRRDKFCSPDEFQFHSPLLKFLKHQADMNVQWLFDDSYPDTSDDREIFLQVNRRLDDIRRGILSATGDNETSVAYQEAMANAIFNYTKDVDDGLGVGFDEVQAEVERDVVRVMRAKKATCTEFAKLYIALARQVGLKVYFIEEFSLDENGRYRHHVAVAVPLSDGRTLVFDLDPEGIDENDSWGPISKLDVMAYGLGNTHLFLKKSNWLRRGGGRCLMRRALEFSPKNSRVLSNYGAEVAYGGKLEESIGYFRESIDNNVYYRDAYTNLRSAYLMLHRYEDADSVCREYKGATGGDICSDSDEGDPR